MGEHCHKLKELKKLAKAKGLDLDKLPKTDKDDKKTLAKIEKHKKDEHKKHEHKKEERKKDERKKDEHKKEEHKKDEHKKDEHKKDEHKKVEHERKRKHMKKAIEECLKKEKCKKIDHLKKKATEKCNKDKKHCHELKELKKLAKAKGLDLDTNLPKIDKKGVKPIPAAIRRRYETAKDFDPTLLQLEENKKLLERLTRKELMRLILKAEKEFAERAKEEVEKCKKNKKHCKHLKHMFRRTAHLCKKMKDQGRDEFCMRNQTLKMKAMMAGLESMIPEDQREEAASAE